jgi:hypothetical protein
MNALNPEIDPEMQFTISDFVDRNCCIILIPWEIVMVHMNTY